MHDFYDLDFKNQTGLMAPFDLTGNSLSLPVFIWYRLALVAGVDLSRTTKK
jgi:hypothetical protein